MPPTDRLIKRQDVTSVIVNSPHRVSVTCPLCEATHTLKYNGGELDAKDCECGAQFELIIERVVLRTSTPRTHW